MKTSKGKWIDEKTQEGTIIIILRFSYRNDANKRYLSSIITIFFIFRKLKYVWILYSFQVYKEWKFRSQF